MERLRVGAAALRSCASPFARLRDRIFPASRHAIAGDDEGGDDTRGNGIAFERPSGPPVRSVGKSLNGLDLSGLDLSHAILRNARFNKASFKGAKLDGAVLDQAWGLEANFSGASLKGANLFASQLQGANLDGADLPRDA